MDAAGPHNSFNGYHTLLHWAVVKCAHRLNASFTDRQWVAADFDSLGQLLTYQR